MGMNLKTSVAANLMCGIKNLSLIIIAKLKKDDPSLLQTRSPMLAQHEHSYFLCINVPPVYYH